jgi:hypothetical protein
MIEDQKFATANVQWANVTYQGKNKSIYNPAILLSEFMKQVALHFADCGDVRLMWDDKG